MKVAVVGLGAAGLRAAMLLEAAGAEVSLFEARHRPGGRICTVDEGEGAVYEGGAEWIDADHRRVLSLLDEVGLSPLENQEWPGKVVYGGEHTTEALLWADALEDDLRVEAAAKDICRDIADPPWSDTRHAEWQDATVADFVREQTRSERGRWWVTAKYRSDEGEDLDRVGLLGWLASYSHYVDRDGDVMSAYRVPGGFGELCGRLLARLRSAPHYGHALLRVRQDSGGVTLYFRAGQLRVDHVVLTLPPRALERVVFEPPLSAGKRCAIEGCGMGRAAKLCWEFAEPWWKSEGWGGSMFCDGPLQQTWDASLGSAHVLCAYVCGASASAWAELGDPVRAGVYELGKLFPAAPKTFRRGWFHNWPHDPWARGGFSHLPAGFDMFLMRHIGESEGRVHFAGEHTASWIGFVEGALESAERVAAEVVQA